MGKTHLAIALRREAILAGYSAQFVTATALVATLAKGHSGRRLEDKLTTLAKAKLLIVNELGYLPLEPHAAHLFFQLVSRRYETARTERRQNGARCSAIVFGSVEIGQVWGLLRRTDAGGPKDQALARFGR